MKISKKFVSLVLCVAMLFSTTAFASMTSAPQNDAKNLAWFTEPFSASGKTVPKLALRGDDTQTAGNLAPYKTIATFTYPERIAGSGDYYASLNVYANENKNSNASGTAGLRYETGPFVLKDRMFSVSYDICINDINGTGVISLVGTNKNSAGTTVTGINRSIFNGFATDETKIDLWDQNSDKSINAGEWYSVRHLFDNKAGYEYMTVTDKDGNVIEITPQATSTILRDANTITMISLTSSVASNFSIDNFTFKDESVFLESNADSFLSTDNVTLTATIPEGFDNAVVMADGDVAGQISPVSGKNVYDVTIPASELGLGNHELILSVSYNDGITRTNATTVVVNHEKETNVLSSNNTGMHQTEVDDFNYLWKDSYVLSDGKYTVAWNYIQNYTKYWQSNEHSPALVRGASGATDDYAIAVAKTSGLLQIKDLNKPILSTGKLVVEFDMLIGEGTGIYSENLGSTNENNFISDNKIFQNISIDSNVWTHVKLVYDTSDSSFVATANGQSYQTSRTFNLSKGYIRFALRQGSMLAIDNSRIYNLVTDPVINSAAYVTASTETETTGAIPANATAIKLYMSEAVDVTADDVALFADGKEISASNVSSANGVVTISLPALTANTDLKVVLNEELSQSFYVTDGGAFFKTAGIVTSGNTATAVIRHMGSGTSSAIVATYNADELVSINVCDFKSAAGIGAVNASVSKVGAAEIKVMAWNTLSSATPKMTAQSYNIN